MGAFDGLNLYRSRPQPSPSEVIAKKPKGFYVSFDGTNGGASGRWSKTRDKAIKVYKKKAREGKNPSAWFDAPELNPN